MSQTGPPTFEDIALEDGFAAWTALTQSVGDYWSGAFTRGATPLELVREWGRWLQVSTARKRPSWSTPHEVAFEAPVARLRDFSTAGSRARVVPTLVLPPQAGHDSCIVDYSPQQSQMRTILAAGLTRAFSLDWIGATAQTRDATIDDYLAVVDRAVDHAGGRVNLVGDCQGGWLATIYAALAPERVNTLTIAGAPIDFHAGEPVIGAVMERMAPGGDLSAYRALVVAGGGTLKGEHMLAGFILIKPDNEVARQAQLLANIHDPDHVARYREFEGWFTHTQDIPGAFYLWIVEHLFRDNKLVRGELRVDGQRVELARIDCPLNLLGGATDHITPPDQVFALADATSTPAAEVTRRTTKGGHLGLFMGREALSEHWPPLLARVAQRSRATR
jgi:poly(3-hydroxybutyrate) depolymerase